MVCLKGQVHAKFDGNEAFAISIIELSCLNVDHRDAVLILNDAKFALHESPPLCALFYESPTPRSIASKRSARC